MDYLKQMKQTTLLSSLSAEEIKRYISDRSFATHVYGKNNIVHFSGEVCSKLEIILSGSIVVDRIDESGNLMTVAEFLSDDILGGNLLFSKNPHYPMTITAKSPTVVLEINRERLFQLFSDNHDFLKSFLEFISDHAMILGDRIKHYVNRTIRESILKRMFADDFYMLNVGVVYFYGGRCYDHDRCELVRPVYSDGQSGLPDLRFTCGEMQGIPLLL